MSEDGQSAVELVAVLPLLVVVALAAGQFLAAGASREQADNAAEAGALAILQDRDPAAAIRTAAPGAHFRVRDGSVSVVIRPRALFPGLADLLTARSSATTPR